MTASGLGGIFVTLLTNEINDQPITNLINISAVSFPAFALVKVGFLFTRPSLISAPVMADLF